MNLFEQRSDKIGLHKTGSVYFTVVVTQNFLQLRLDLTGRSGHFGKIAGDTGSDDSGGIGRNVKRGVAGILENLTRYPVETGNDIGQQKR